MAKYDKKAALKIMIEAAKKYEEKLNDKHFLIVYREGKDTKTARVEFRDMNFLHMTGVKSRLSAQQFYAACLEAKLSERDFEIDNKGKVQQKLMVLPYLAELLYHHCLIGDFINSGICIKADYFVGDTRAVLSVGFRTGKKADFPVTLYNEDVRKLSQPTNKVLAIFSKHFKDQHYHKCTYLAKNQSIQKLRLSDEVFEMLLVDEE